MMTLLIVLNFGRRRIGDATYKSGWKLRSFGSLIQFKFNVVNAYFANLMKLGKDPI
jgi:hypothetical protein